MTRNARRLLFDVRISSEFLGNVAWRSICATAGAVLVSSFLATMNWWTAGAPRHPGPGYAWDLRPRQPILSPVNELFSETPASAITLFIAFGVYLSIARRFAPRRFITGTVSGLPLMVLSSAAWAYINGAYSLPDWLDIGFLIPSLLALAASIWTVRPKSDPTIREAERLQFVALQTSAIADKEHSSTWGWLLPAIAVMVGAGLAWSARPIPRFHSLVWSSLWGAAIRYVLVVQLGAIFAACLTFAALKYRGVSPRLRYVQLLGAAAIAWVAPLALFVTQTSWWALLAVIIVVSSATGLASSGYHGKAGESPQRSSRSFELLAAPPLPPFFRQILPGLAAAFCLNCVMLAALANRPLIATVLCGVGAAIVTWQWIAWTYSAERRVWSSLWQILPIVFWVATAIIFTAAGLTRYLSAGSTTDFHANRGKTPPIQLSSDLPSYKGVILFQERRPEKLVVPRPTSLLFRQTLAPRASQPLNIPFDGVYWYYQPPDRQPRQDSLRERGSPADLRFQSNDGRSLLMEARQNLGRLVDVGCCSEILLTITNAETDPTVVDLDLSLTNTTIPGTPVLHLGDARAADQPPTGLHYNKKSAQQTLAYKIPAAPTIRQFDELIVAFHRAEPTSIRSTKVAINQFVLVPRR